ncbi:leucyl aminopeptidase (aminopeptidase T) [Desulfosporosinus acidiphilus SJ4]|uniref:Leucyl aminopeptidase (Aminopeptidase T) n=1 Tax=Desulfosporosinus acidiphilus (strain DSM 22704 / JCM 16185 / SJ4) TaxID=646529 RepID=I4D4L0_DESAJ|nr:aminopeptidase [Desulfosporosinus acidiphilus]AFM40734.1 leucyl aminopeptidase (aminopeptidase T) [Desulfosporosinus acidiphilus SJ4]
MKDQRIEKLADSLINYSIALKPGEKILIEVIGSEIPLAQALVRHAYQAGGMPFVSVINNTLMRELLKEFTLEQAEAMTRWDLARMKEMQAYIGIRAGENASEWSDIPSGSLKLYSSFYQKKVHSEQRVPHTRWCVLRYPTASMAQLAAMSVEGFEDFYFDVCNLDYAKMSQAMEPLKNLMEKTDQVRILGPGTDLVFSIKDMPAIKCDGLMNIPDGEIYTAPIKESVNGRISYNTPSLYQGFTYETIVLEFKKGKIIKATANDTQRIEEIFNTDEGARYVGEFAIGMNPYIMKPMKDTLFDEKIDGSFHFTPGSCYDDCNNGNKSAIHWDLVSIQRPDYGGGEIYFDGKLIRKNGRFVLAELECLNPENLK